jgi:FKBP-type peptidyl-prolyl cis-trans isomerase
MNRPARSLALLLPLVMLGCGTDTSAEVPTIESTIFAQALGVDLAASTKTSSGLYFRDLVVGAGTAVTTGQQVSVRYSGWLANGTHFDSNPSPAAPFVFRIGTGSVIEGWDLGVPGMKVGGQRQLIIPPALGYGPAGNGPIPANSILVFTVTVISAQ